MFYLNVPPDEVVQIDPVSEKILNTVHLSGYGCTVPHGMAIGPDHQIAIGCNAGTSSVILSEDFSNIIALPGESGTDQTWYNPGDNHYFFASELHLPHPQLGVVDAVGDGSGTPVEDAPAASTDSSHTVAADPVRNQVYVPISTESAATGFCKAHGGIDANGCIAVFTVVPGTGPDDAGICPQQGASRDGVALHANCPPKGAN
jgi:hypothetical protein